MDNQRHHDYRNDTDDIIAESHHGIYSFRSQNPQVNQITGPSLIYLSPDPPTENSFVKLWHSGKYENNPFPLPGKWSTTSDIRKNFGHMNMRIPADLKAGQFVLHMPQLTPHHLFNPTAT
jgi:cellulase